MSLLLNISASFAASETKLQSYQNNFNSSIPVLSYVAQFPKDYDSSRERFRSYSSSFKQKNISLQHLSQNLEGPFADLSLDALYLEGVDKHKLLIISSGIHGAEAFAGSALMDLFAQHLLAANSLNTSVLLIHSLNPFGFKYFRRTNSNNVDLNRNHADDIEFLSKNAAYETFAEIYGNSSRASVGLVPQIGFYLSLFTKYFRHGKKVILDSLSGQYQYQKGIFYGGTRVEPESQTAQDWITQFSKDKTHIVHIDIHTGFGEKGHLHLFGSDEYDSKKNIQNLKAIFPNVKIDTGRDKDFYPTHGDFVDWTWKSQPQKFVVPMVFEFGTMNSQTLHGGLRSLWTTVLENQGYHYDYSSESDRIEIRQHFEQLFNPQSAAWQNQTMKTGLPQLIDAYEKLWAI